MSWKEDFKGQLRDIGIVEGDLIYVSVSFQNNLELLPKANDLLDIFIDVVGDRGTLIMPTYTNKLPMWQVYLNHNKFIYDKESTQPNTGILPSLLMRNKNAIRSNHPTNSIVCIGMRSTEIVEVHDEKSGAYSIFSWLESEKGKALFMGTGSELPALRHEIQSRIGLLEKVPYWQGVRYQNRGEGNNIFKRKDVGGCVVETKQMIEILRSSNFILEGEFQKMDYYLIDLSKAVKILINDMRNNLENYLCSDPLCSWCRFIERKENVHKSERLGKGKTYPCNKVLRSVFNILLYFHIKSVPYSHYLLLKLARSIQKNKSI